MTIVFALLLTALVEFVLRYGFGASLPGFGFIGLYLLLYYLIDYARKKGSDDSDMERWSDGWGDYPIEDLSGVTASGPIRHFGKWAMATVFFASQILAILNPWQLVEIIKQLGGNFSLAWRERKTKHTYQDYETQLDYRLPVESEWLVLNGGMTPKTSHSWDILGQRFAIDLVKVDEGLARHRSKGTRLEDYFCYGEPIVAAQDGVVVASESRVNDAPFLGWGVCDITARSFIGNYLMIKHAPGEYGLYAHLQPKSLLVGIGDQVKKGQQIGRCGHTGHSTEPHLHFHIQDSPDPYHGMGLPVAFSDLSVGGRRATRVRLRAGYRVNAID